ncbi:follicle cell protein 3C-1-like [Uranotaenia lowii]|uniref:follicle cell protein 3C-1-like n=1 Tax=Uranotaenia lowii TaxID=190385 RepID=UPI0024793BF3|nr:follicle cell protein 3C-1-like [Uranotaenia lowii]
MGFKIRAVVIIIKVIVVLMLIESIIVSSSAQKRMRSRKTKQVPTDVNESQLVQSTSSPTKNEEHLPCSCAIFLTGQFNRHNRTEPPRGNPAIQVELMQNYPCTSTGNKQCSSRCLDTIMKHLPNSPALICGTIGRDCFRERAYLFYQNCSPRWINSNLSAGREFCCQNDRPVRCSKMATLLRQSLLTRNGTHESNEEY